MNSAIAPRVTRTRTTRETSISLTLSFSGGRENDIQTGIGFLDHMLATLALHANWQLQLQASGDLQIDDHHTVEDCALVLGEAINELLGDRRQLSRFGSAYAPLDESLARAVVDLVSRPHATVALGLRRESVGTLACENVRHFFVTLAHAARITLHVDLIRGENDHHRIEAAFKATALALRQALAPITLPDAPSTKGVL